LAGVEGRDPIDDLVDALGRWAAADRAARAAGDRSRERVLREQAGAAATWSGVLVDLAERRAAVTLAVAGARRSGRLVGIGQDFVVFDQRGGHPALVILDAIDAVWTEDPVGAGSAVGSRPAALDLSLVAALAGLADERTPVALLLSGGDEVTGDLVGMGADVLTVRRPSGGRTGAATSGSGHRGGGQRRAIVVPVGAVALCELR
jgi:hypothetical protein